MLKGKYSIIPKVATTLNDIYLTVSRKQIMLVTLSCAIREIVAMKIHFMYRARPQAGCEYCRNASFS